ncbi:hypothetical protein [Aestuariivivens sediminicola]|uniref:hypothetical protein n=1 Tax=Aestuariivivens sediminicola TaxID=2913560 RepID=UPI001F580C0D|nr:hypothetical protein [Aestuariivivens sediminicola]
MKTIYSIFYIICAAILSGCSGGSDDPNPDPGPVEVDPPGAATLVFPNENSECTEGTNITDTESDVLFNWNDATNTTSYQLVVKNLKTQSTAQFTTSDSQLNVTLLRATPYSWYIVSRNSGTETTQSATWKFYNAGPATSSYAPFPAELVAPQMGMSLPSASPNTLLEWEGSDVDNDITGYDVLFGTTSPPTNTEATNLSATELEVDVTSGTTYYWQVLTHDNEGHSSSSPIFEFKVN